MAARSKRTPGSGVSLLSGSHASHRATAPSWDALRWAISTAEAMPGPAVVVGSDGSILASSAEGESLAQIFRAGQPGANLAAQVLRDGQPRRAQLTLERAQPRFDIWLSALDGAGVLCVARDLSVEHKVLKALVQSRELFRDLVTCSTDFAFEVGPDGEFRYVSLRGALGFGAWELVGRSAISLRANEVAQEAGGGAPAVSAASPFAARAPQEGVEVWLSRKDGSAGCFQLSLIPVLDASGQFDGVRGVARDVTEIHLRDRALSEAHARLEQVSRLDELTGLLNRRAFEAALRPRLAHLARHRRNAALLYFDLDNFKAINDLQGHHQGDAALAALAGRVRAELRAGDLAARLGGDEFALWMEEVSAEGASARAERLLTIAAELNREFGVANRPLGLSIGAALSTPVGAETAERLIYRADAAMYEAKRGGKNRLHISPRPACGPSCCLFDSDACAEACQAKPA
jgi:diguanylate cyclase (GGDEF)-like protein/PAS domain S-box-containing protein